MSALRFASEKKEKSLILADNKDFFGWINNGGSLRLGSGLSLSTATVFGVMLL